MFDQDVTRIGASVGIIAALAGMFLKLWSIAAKFAQLELKVNTLWDFLMRRSIETGISNGVITMNSPIKSTESMEELLAPMINDFADFYKYSCCGLSDRDTFIAFEREFGDRILREICIPHKIHQGAAIFAAIDVAKMRGGKCVMNS